MDWLRGHWQLLALTALVAVLWNTPIMLPLKILVVFFHEVAHGAAAVLTGGEIVLLTVSADQGGLAVTRGGSRVAILTAGYLGSLVIGVVLLLAGLRSTADRVVLGGLGVAMFVIAALYVREMFALGFCIAVGAALIGIARYLPHAASDLVLRVIGLSSLIYVPRDIVSDTIARPHLRSDAAMLAELVGGSTQAWGAIWLVISLVVIAVALRFGLGQASNLDFRIPRKS